MKNFNWKLPLKLNILKLKIVGLWPQGDETYKFNLYTIWAICTITVFTFGHNFFQMVNVVLIFDNLRAMVRTFYVTLSELAGLIKAIFIIQNMKVLKQLMITLDDEMFQPRNETQIEMIKPSFNFWKANYRAYWTMSLGSIICWSIYPFLETSAAEFPLPFLAWYPWNIKVSPLYEITYVYQVLGLLCIATTAIAADTLIAALNVYVGAQFDILCDNITHLFDENDNINERLTDCVKHHKEILRFAESSNRFANWVVLGQFFTSAVTIGITLFQMTVSEPLSSEFFSCISFTIAMIVEIFMYCWFGNEVTIKSSNVCRAIYESKWTEAPVSIKRNLIFLLLKCQKPVKVSALDLFYLSLETFVKILRAAWSYFALLHHMTSK